MIGKIFVNTNYDVYYKVLYHNPLSSLCTGTVIKSNSPYFIVGLDYLFYFNLLEEITEEQYNKIRVFE